MCGQDSRAFDGLLVIRYTLSGGGKEVRKVQYFLGVDIGGTKSHALVVDDRGRALGFGIGGAGNHEVVGYNGLTDTLQFVTQEALTMASISGVQIAGAGFGVAGYDWPSEREPTLAAIQTLGLSAPLAVVNDTVIGLLAGASQGWGVAVVAGTGCNCWGWGRDRRVGRVTGMGMDFGEFAGGGDIVWRATQAVNHEWIQRGPATRLTQAFLIATGALDSADLLEGLTLGRYRLGAGAAPLVFQVATAGDPVARQIVTWAGEELGWLAVSVIRQLQFQTTIFEVVLIGSLFEAGGILLEPMQAIIYSEAPGAKLVRLNVPPVVGGALLGMAEAGYEAYHLRQSLMDSLQALLGRGQGPLASTMLD